MNLVQQVVRDLSPGEWFVLQDLGAGAWAYHCQCGEVGTFLGKYTHGELEPARLNMAMIS